MRMLFARRSRMLVVVAALSMILAACSTGADGNGSADGGATGTDNSDSGESDPGDSGDSAAAGGELVIAVTSENTTLASYESGSEVNSPGLKNIFEGLVTRDPETNELVGELATKWEQAEDTVWRFTLREGVTYHDGTPFNAESAAFAINYVWAEEQDFPIRQFMGSQITAEAVDEYTLDVITEEPDPIIPERMYFTGLPSATQLQEDIDSYETNPIGTGPYRYGDWARGQHFQIEANPDWWGHDSEDAVGEVTFDSVRFVFRSEGGVRTSMVQSDEADIAQYLTPEQCQTLIDADGTDCLSAPSTETLFIRFDTPNPVLADERVRLAIIQAINHESIREEIIGFASPASQLVGPSAVGHDPDLQPHPYDPDAAAELVEQARADGVPVDQPLMINVRQEAIPRIEEVAQAVQNMLTEIGLNVELQIQEASIFNPEFGEKPTADRNYITIHPHGNEMMDAASSYGSYARCEPGVSGICVEELDQMIAEASQQTGEDREEAFHEIAQYIHEDALLGFIGHLDLTYGIDESIEWDVPLDHRLLATQISRQ